MGGGFHADAVVAGDIHDHLGLSASNCGAKSASGGRAPPLSDPWQGEFTEAVFAFDGGGGRGTFLADTL